MDGGDAVRYTLMRGGINSGRARAALIVLGLFVLLAGAKRTDAQRHRDPCRLLSDTEVRAIQGHAPEQKIPSEQPSASFKFTQCLYRTAEFTSSVSVALGIPLETDSKRSGPRDYWQTQVDALVKTAPGRKKKEPPKPVTGLGAPAFWVGDPVTGALYVLKGEVLLRLSVGGPPDQAQKIKRAKALAIYALRRLDTSSPTTRSR
jgi:hypothetical protein